MLATPAGFGALCKEVAEVLRPMFADLNGRGVVHRDALFMVFGIRSVNEPWFEEVYSASLGSQPQEDWEHPFDDIARGKARLTGRTGLPSREVQLMKPHLLRREDVRYWGSWIEDDIIVAASGVKPWYDEAFCKMACALVLAGSNSFRAVEDEECDGLGLDFYRVYTEH